MNVEYLKLNDVIKCTSESEARLVSKILFDGGIHLKGRHSKFNYNFVYNKGMNYFRIIENTNGELGWDKTEKPMNENVRVVMGSDLLKKLPKTWCFKSNGNSFKSKICIDYLDEYAYNNGSGRKNRWASSLKEGKEYYYGIDGVNKYNGGTSRVTRRKSFKNIPIELTIDEAVKLIVATKDSKISEDEVVTIPEQKPSKESRFPFHLYIDNASKIIKTSSPELKNTLASKWSIDLFENNYVVIDEEDYNELRIVTSPAQKSLMDEIFGKDDIPDKTAVYVTDKAEPIAGYGVGFYDAINKRLFNVIDGSRTGLAFENYEIIPENEITERIRKMQKKLKD